jgi:hypothetical protein
LHYLPLQVGGPNMTFENTSPQSSERTALATLVAIVAVVPAIIPAGLAVIVYGFFFSRYMYGSWIPYLDEIGGIWFPEMVRGMVMGAAAIWVSRYFFPKSNVEAVRLATLAFWGALSLLLLGLSIAVRGLALDMIAVVAVLTGLGAGLWMVDQ